MGVGGREFGDRYWELVLGVGGARVGKGWNGVGTEEVGSSEIADGRSEIGDGRSEFADGDSGVGEFSAESGRGLPQSGMLARGSVASGLRGASGSFSGKVEGRMQKAEAGAGGWGAGGTAALSSSRAMELLL